MVRAPGRSLGEIAAIHEQCGIDLEVFAHGSICFSYSGVCLLSSFCQAGRSANRGMCAQPCRLPYELIDEQGREISAPGRGRPLCPRDTCTTDLLPQLVDTGASALKLEGRMKAADYVFSVTDVYRRELDDVLAGRNAGEKEQAVYYSRRLLLTAYCGAWVMNLSAFLFANRFVISLFNLSPEAQAMALDIMVWFNIVSLFVWPSSFTLPNILRAAGDARFTMTVSIVSMWAFRVGFCYVMVLGFHGRLLSIWMGMFLDWAMRSLFFCVRFVRGRWMEQKVI